MSIPHLVKVLGDKKTVVRRAVFWRIPHHTDKQDVRLKIGRYKKSRDGRLKEEPETQSPKSELTLDDEEFLNLIGFVQENYEPFKAGTKAFIPLDRPFDDSDTAEAVKAFFNLSEKRELVDFLLKHDIIPEHLLLALHQKHRLNAIAKFDGGPAVENLYHLKC